MHIVLENIVDFCFIQDDLRIENRKKNLIILVLQWFAEEGYIDLYLMIQFYFDYI